MKIKMILPVFILSLMLAACEHDYLAYDTQLKDGIYFVEGDSVNFQFGLNTEKDVVYRLVIGVLGIPSEQNRTYRLELDPERTTAREGVHFDFDKEMIVKAGDVSDTINVVFHRYSDPLLTTQAFHIFFRLVENELFRPVVTPEFRFEMSDKEIPEPDNWRYTNRFFGPYSQGLYLRILGQYHALAETMPGYYERMKQQMGENLENLHGMPAQFSSIMYKYVLLPVWEYYQENPDPKVNMPDPRDYMY